MSLSVYIPIYLCDISLSLSLSLSLFDPTIGLPACDLSPSICPSAIGDISPPIGRSVDRSPRSLVVRALRLSVISIHSPIRISPSISIDLQPSIRLDLKPVSDSGGDFQVAAAAAAAAAAPKPGTRKERRIKAAEERKQVAEVAAKEKAAGFSKAPAAAPPPPPPPGDAGQ